MLVQKKTLIEIFCVFWEILAPFLALDKFLQ